MALLQLQVSILKKLLTVKCFLNTVSAKLHLNHAAVHESSGIANDSGTSGGMEGRSIMTIFERSEAHNLVRFTKYLGDGD
ncbi:hypothetical protein TNCV_569451 [Trichonephila clavipes]|nr:hypothetical protein TNCV_569451 [Trichonephila clavipes]